MGSKEFSVLGHRHYSPSSKNLIRIMSHSPIDVSEITHEINPIIHHVLTACTPAPTCPSSHLPLPSSCLPRTSPRPKGLQPLHTTHCTPQYSRTLPSAPSLRRCSCPSRPRSVSLAPAKTLFHLLSWEGRHKNRNLAIWPFFPIILWAILSRWPEVATVKKT